MDLSGGQRGGGSNPTQERLLVPPVNKESSGSISSQYSNGGGGAGTLGVEDKEWQEHSTKESRQELEKYCFTAIRPKDNPLLSSKGNIDSHLLESFSMID